MGHHVQNRVAIVVEVEDEVREAVVEGFVVDEAVREDQALDWFQAF